MVGFVVKANGGPAGRTRNGSETSKDHPNMFFLSGNGSSMVLSLFDACMWSGMLRPGAFNLFLLHGSCVV